MNKQNINKTQRANFVFIFPRLRVVGKIGKQLINHVLLFIEREFHALIIGFFFFFLFTTPCFMLLIIFIIDPTYFPKDFFLNIEILLKF